jgi:DNA-3-methyladenine glycosylase
MPLELSRLEKFKRSASFFQRPAQYVAKNILGDYLVLKKGKKILVGKIVETESYLGIEDDASHSFGGKVTERNKIMYNDGGIIYVYLIYGMFFCFNVVVSRKNNPQAVFIRALEPLEGIEIMKKNRKITDVRKLTNGPCKWTDAFGINKAFLGKNVTSDDIFISRNSSKKFDIVSTKRVGVEYAANSAGLPLRFYIRGNLFVSKL